MASDPVITAATIQQVIETWRNYRREHEQEQTPGFYRGLKHCADELEAVLRAARTDAPGGPQA